jgi:hypothetical protein
MLLTTCAPTPKLRIKSSWTRSDASMKPMLMMRRSTRRQRRGGRQADCGGDPLREQPGVLRQRGAPPQDRHARLRGAAARGCVRIPGDPREALSAAGAVSGTLRAIESRTAAEATRRPFGFLESRGRAAMGTGRPGRGQRPAVGAVSPPPRYRLPGAQKTDISRR